MPHAQLLGGKVPTEISSLGSVESFYELGPGKAHRTAPRGAARMGRVQDAFTACPAGARRHHEAHPQEGHRRQRGGLRSGLSLFQPPAVLPARGRGWEAVLVVYAAKHGITPPHDFRWGGRCGRALVTFSTPWRIIIIVTSDSASGTATAHGFTPADVTRSPLPPRPRPARRRRFPSRLAAPARAASASDPRAAPSGPPRLHTGRPRRPQRGPAA